MSTEGCLRYNNGKSELAYLLSFAGGTSRAFASSRFRGGLEMLSAWYKGYGDGDPRDAVQALVDALDPNWPTLLAQVSAKGAQKYARGNYLKGQSWHHVCCCLLRHMDAIERKGEKDDPETGISHDGHIAWNLLFLLHCVRMHPEFDDRLRAPK